jgi:solute carrier family 25 carnitine/acylcarnitine transporter 20/29
MSSIFKNMIYPKPIPDINNINTIINNTNTNTKPPDTQSLTFINNSIIKRDNHITKYINGGISGMCGVLISHPIDTIKTHIQTGNKLNTFKPSFTNFYKGISAPLIGVGIEKAIVFGTYNYMFSKTENIPLSGALSGLAASLIVTPYERLKILKQNSQIVSIKDINIKFLFRGLSATFTREVPGFAIYFTTYEYLKKKTFSENNKKIDYVSSFMYGGISGTTAWIFIYPQDKIKTILQSSKDTHIKTIITTIYKSGGLKQFYSGFGWAVARASLLHSGTFCIMEYLSNTNH